MQHTLAQHEHTEPNDSDCPAHQFSGTQATAYLQYVTPLCIYLYTIGPRSLVLMSFILVVCRADFT